jgi:hypothetical protein
VKRNSGVAPRARRRLQNVQQVMRLVRVDLVEAQCDGFKPSCVLAFALIGLKLPPISDNARYRVGECLEAERFAKVRGALDHHLRRRPDLARLVAGRRRADHLRRLFSSSQHSQYSMIAAASVDFAFLRATSSSADVKRRVPSRLAEAEELHDEEDVRRRAERCSAAACRPDSSTRLQRVAASR